MQFTLKVNFQLMRNKGFVYIFGGFGINGNTLLYCEKFNMNTNVIEDIADMIHTRAYGTACKINNEFIFLFGGYNNELIDGVINISIHLIV